MRLLLVLLMIVWGLVLALVSLPFVLLGIGYDMIGDEEAGDRWHDRAPLTLWLNYMESRS